MRDLTAIVVTGGAAVPASVRDDLPDSAWVVAADSGLEHARRIGLPVDVVVGDLDSVPERILEGFSGPVEHHPADKDHTDLQLALELVARHGHIDRLIVVGGGGGRLDHLLGNVAVLAAPAYAHLRVEWLTGAERVHVVWDHVELHGHAGDVVSLMAIGGPALGVTTEGLQWPLRGARLDPSTSLGMSNVMQGAVATVNVSEGRLLTIQPDPES
jgi:thiamine pyrophosphokinase